MSKLNFKKNQAPENQSQRNQGEPPSNGQVLTVDILEIKESHVNPRKSKGDKYDSIKNSVRQVGLLQMFAVTKLPGQKKYELFNGGNTRLKILHELYEESIEEKDEEQANRVRFQQCLFVPYTDDLDILVKHMTENEERSKMTFIDKARAVFQIKELYLQQNNLDDVSNNQLVKYIHEKGWTSIYQPWMTELTFAYNKLDSVIPLALKNGMGKPKVQQLRLWLNYTEKYVGWLLEQFNYDYSFEKAETLYFDLLRGCDDDLEPINLEEFYHEFIFELSNQLMEFNPKLKYETVKFEFKNIEELGYVPEEKPIEELREELEETQEVPRLEYPEGRKPRQPRSEMQEITDAEAHIDKIISDSTNQVNVTEPSVDTPISETISETNSKVLQVECFEKASQILAELFKQCGYNQVFRELISFWDSEDPMQSIPPFFKLNLSTDQLRNQITEIINGGDQPEQYLALHLMYVYVVYHRNDIDISQLDEEALNTFKNLMQIWHESSLKFVDYLGICQTGLVMTNPQKDKLLNVHQLTQEHLRLCSLVEKNYYSGDGSE